jgi:hypothetical protein
MNNAFMNRMTIDLGDQKREIVGNFEALSAIQTEMNAGELEVIRRFGTGRFGIKEITSIIFNGLKANGDNRLTRSQVGDLILQSKKYDEYSAICVEFLSMSLDTGESVGKEEEQEKASE